MSVTLYSLGAAQEVTGSKHLIEVDGRLFLIDCGAFQGKRGEADRKNREFDITADKLEAVILTHAHYDHCGLLPVLSKKGFHGNIYATPASRDLADLIMMDSAHIQAHDAEYLRKQAAKKGEKFTWQPLFTEKDVVQAANQIITLSYNRAMYIAPDIQLEFFDAGHILGSAFAFVTISNQRENNKVANKPDNAIPKKTPKEILTELHTENINHFKNFWGYFFGRADDEGSAENSYKKGDSSESASHISTDKKIPDQRDAVGTPQKGVGGGSPKRVEKDPEHKDVRILFTGDLGRKNKPIIRDPSTNMPAPDYIVMESTYGNRKHEDPHVAMDELAKIVKRAVAQRGKIIIPSFAIERTQELVYYFHLLVDSRRIPEIPIYVDSPMATNATSIFQIHPECYDEATHDAFLEHHKNPFGFNSLSFVTSVEESKSLNDRDEPMIIISADGMCEAGRILHHLANNIGKSENTVLLVGFMAENTLGRRLQNREEEVKIMGNWYNVKADIQQINAFSAHADYAECTQWLKTIDTSRLKRIFMVHGEPDAQAFFQKYLNENGFPNVTVVKYGETYDLN